jgi:hypothetical protein
MKCGLSRALRVSIRGGPTVAASASEWVLWKFADLQSRSTVVPLLALEAMEETT